MRPADDLLAEAVRGASITGRDTAWAAGQRLLTLLLDEGWIDRSAFADVDATLDRRMTLAQGCAGSAHRMSWHVHDPDGMYEVEVLQYGEVATRWNTHMVGRDVVAMLDRCNDVAALRPPGEQGVARIRYKQSGGRHKDLSVPDKAALEVVVSLLGS